MAFTYNTLQSVVQDYMAPRLVDNTSRGCPFFYWLKENGRLSIRGGEQISQSIVKSHLDYEWYDSLDEQTLAAQEPLTRARFPWSWIRVPWVIPETELDKAQGETAIADLMDATEQVASLTMAEALSLGLFGTNSSNAKQMLGLQDMAAASGTSYAGLLDTDFTSPSSWLMDIYTPLSGNIISAEDLRRQRGNVTRGGARPNLGLCNFSVYAKIWTIAQGVQRFGIESTAKLGFDHLMFEDMPIMPDVHSPGSGYTSTDNWLFMLNTDYIKLVVHPNKAFATRVYQPIPQFLGNVGTVLFGGQLTTSQRRSHSVCKTYDPDD